MGNGRLLAQIRFEGRDLETHDRSSGVIEQRTRIPLLNFLPVLVSNRPDASKCRSVKELFRLVASPVVCSCQLSTYSKSAAERVRPEREQLPGAC